MSNTLKANIYEVKIGKIGNLFEKPKPFEEILREIATKLNDSNKDTGILVFDKKKDTETSIWFDSFDYNDKFANSDILKETVCFLLAKDIDLSIVENKTEEKLESFVTNDKIRPKIPSHCIFLPNKNILIMENNTNKSITIGTIKNGITNILYDTKDYLSFTPILRQNIIERLKFFTDKIQSLKLIDLKLQNFLDNSEDTDGQLLNIISNPEAKFTVSLQLENEKSEYKKSIIGVFESILSNKTNYALKNMQIMLKDEKEQKEVVELYNNLVSLTIETEHGYNEYNFEERITYSISIYEALVKEFYAKNMY